MALKKAMEQAEFLAREAGARLGKPVNISYAEREAAVSRELGLVDRDRIVVTGARLSRPSTSIDLPPGVLSVEERVTVTFELLRGR